MHHSDIIAGKPAPTGLMQLLWGAAAGDSGAGAGLMHHSDFIAGKPAPTGLMQLLWGAGCRRFGGWGWSDAPQRFHRGQARSHRFDAAVVGSWLPAIPTGLMQLLWGLAAGDSHRFDAVVVGAGLPAIRALAQR